MALSVLSDLDDSRIFSVSAFVKLVLTAGSIADGNRGASLFDESQALLSLQFHLHPVLAGSFVFSQNQPP